ncbi:MAG: hypothetical protein K2P68_11090 [Sphingomonas sp.]|nr:hypothetical protein [Sphingomonas sp.]
MKPPWIAYPDIAPGMGWRMGFGACYSDKFAAWFGNLKPQDQQSLMLSAPEPEGFKGYYQNIIDYWLRDDASDDS